MTRHTSGLTVAVLVALLVGAVALPAVAVSEPRDSPSSTSPPVRVYVSETLDISAVELSGSDRTIGTEPTTLVAVGGGTSFTVDPTSADFDGVAPGAYYVEGDRDVRADVTVIRPQVYSVVLRNERQQDVTGGRSDPADLDRLSIRARYNFAEADRLDVSVVDPSGSEVATGRITENDQQILVDIPDPTPGLYSVTVTGSNIEAGNRTVTVRARGQVATPTPTPTAEPTPTTTATPTPTSTAEPTPTATPTPTPTAEPTPTATPTPTPTSTPTATVTEGGGPGFGVVAAALAVLALALLGRRR